MTQDDDEPRLTLPEIIVDHATIMAFEHYRAEQLAMQARQMTELGLPGEDPDSPRIRDLLERGTAATKTFGELVEWIARHK